VPAAASSGANRKRQVPHACLFGNVCNYFVQFIENDTKNMDNELADLISVKSLF